MKLRVTVDLIGGSHKTETVGQEVVELPYGCSKAVRQYGLSWAHALSAAALHELSLLREPEGTKHETTKPSA